MTAPLVTYLLDTNVCIALLKGRSTELEKRVRSISSDEAAIPAVLRFELHYGAGKSYQPDQTREKPVTYASSTESTPFGLRTGRADSHRH